LGSIELNKIHAEVTAVHVSGPPEPEDNEALRYITETKLVENTELHSRIHELFRLGAPGWLIALVVYGLIPPEKAAQRHEEESKPTWYLALPSNESRPLIMRHHGLCRDARSALHAKRIEHHQLVLEAFNNRMRDDGFMTVSQRLAARIPSDKPRQRSAPGTLPPRPGRGASCEEWFEYKRLMGRKFTHKELAGEISVTPGYARHLFAVWKSGIENEIAQNT